MLLDKTCHRYRNILKYQYHWERQTTIIIQKKGTDMKEFIMKYWLEALFGLAITGLTFCVNHIRKKLNEQEAVK